MSTRDFEGLICPACSNSIDEKALTNQLICSHCKTNLKDKKYLAFVEFLMLHISVDINMYYGW